MDLTLKDVVCGTEVNSISFAYDAMGTRYAFCSARCRERFLARQHLYVGLADQRTRQESTAAETATLAVRTDAS